jgi:hypothetical protein
MRCDTHFNPVTRETVAPPVRAVDVSEPEPSYDPIYESPRQPVSTGVVLGLLGMVAVLGLVVIVVAVIKSGGNSQSPKKETPVVRRAEPPPRVVPSDPDPNTVFSTVFTWYLIAAVFAILYLVGVVLMLAWVARDAKNRNIDGGAVWVLVILFTGFIGLLVYLASRPSGALTLCDNCHNKRLLYVRNCPHCGIATASPG